MKIISRLLAVFAIIVLYACGTAKHTTNMHSHEHSRDSVVVHDTSYVQVKVVDEERVQAEINAFKAVTDSTVNNYKAMNDSLATELLAKDIAMQKLLIKIAKQQYSIPAISKSTEFAKATAGITNNQLWLELWQMPVDTILTVINTHTNVTNTTVDANSTQEIITKEVALPVWKNPWFLSTILILLALVAFVLWRIASKLIIT